MRLTPTAATPLSSASSSPTNWPATAIRPISSADLSSITTAPSLDAVFLYHYPAGMVRHPLTADQIAAGRRLGAALRAARADRSLVGVALAAGISPETLRK